MCRGFRPFGVVVEATIASFRAVGLAYPKRDCPILCQPEIFPSDPAQVPRLIGCNSGLAPTLDTEMNSIGWLVDGNKNLTILLAQKIELVCDWTMKKSLKVSR